MTPQEIKEIVVRLEAFADGIKNGAQLFAKGLLDTMEQQAKANTSPAPSDTEQKQN